MIEDVSLKEQTGRDSIPSSRFVCSGNESQVLLFALLRWFDGDTIHETTLTGTNLVSAISCGFVDRV